MHIYVYDLANPRRPKTAISCPKCLAISGDAYVQYDGLCPMTMSPHFSEECEIAYKRVDRSDQPA
jgi:hypothetical protein